MKWTQDVGQQYKRPERKTCVGWSHWVCYHMDWRWGLEKFPMANIVVFLLCVCFFSMGNWRLLTKFLMYFRVHSDHVAIDFTCFAARSPDLASSKASLKAAWTSKLSPSCHCSSQCHLCSSNILGIFQIFRRHLTCLNIIVHWGQGGMLASLKNVIKSLTMSVFSNSCKPSQNNKSLIISNISNSRKLSQQQ